MKIIINNIESSVNYNDEKTDSSMTKAYLINGYNYDTLALRAFAIQLIDTAVKTDYKKYRSYLLTCYQKAKPGFTDHFGTSRKDPGAINSSDEVVEISWYNGLLVSWIFYDAKGKVISEKQNNVQLKNTTQKEKN